MRKGIVYLLIAVLLLVAPAALRYLRYYDLGDRQRATPPAYEPAKIAQVPTPDAADFQDEPQVGGGLVLLDRAHRNNFLLEEIGYLDGRLAARGFELLPYEEGDLATALRPVRAFIVITPLDAFSTDEIQAVSNFVSRGGRLLLVGDPTRFEVFIDEESLDFSFTLETDEIPLNSLANEFDIIFNGDYLYNTTENEGNFRNIILKKDGLAEGDLVGELERLVFYGAHSLQIGPDGDVLIEADDNTWSSATDRPGVLTLAGVGSNGRVLALGDFHFLTEPYYTVHDNSHFIANIADFLVKTAERSFILADFPYFYRAPVDLIYIASPDLGPDAFDEIIALQDAFRDIDHSLQLSAQQQAGHDALYLGLYNQADDVVDILASTGISLTIDPPILTEAELREQAAAEAEAQPGEEVPASEEGETDASQQGEGKAVEEPEELIRLVQSDLGNVQMSGTALILLDESGGRRKVVVLAASNDGLENTVGRLLDLIPLDAEYALADCLLQANLALCPTSIADEEVEAELDTGGSPEMAAKEEEVVEEGTGEPPPEEDTTGQELDAVGQGAIGLNETVDGTLAENERHSWLFSEGPATVDIVASADDLDLVLELYGPDNALIDSADSGFTGEGEQLLGTEIPDDAEYHVVVSDFFGSSGSYTLTVTLAEEAGETSGGVFIFADDDGVPLAGGFTSAEALATLLDDSQPVTTWTSSVDGPLGDDTLAGYDLLIWDSGDYQDVEGPLDDDSAVIFDYVDAGGDLFVIGASPTIFGETELSSLADLEVSGDDPVLLNGFEPGEIIELDQVYDAITDESFQPDSGEGTVTFFLRGPNSAESGNVVGMAIEEDQKTVFLLAPFTAMPTEIQERLLANLVDWFGLSNS